LNSLVLPLVVSLAAISAHNDDYRPAARPVGPWVDARAMAEPLPPAYRVTTPGLEDALAQSSYPESLRFADSTVDAQAAPHGNRSLVVADKPRPVPEWLASTGQPDDEFDVTHGGGLVGIGFRWRFR
jgi:hypothetical protein